jgi:hypothetical protein
MKEKKKGREIEAKKSNVGRAKNENITEQYKTQPDKTRQAKTSHGIYKNKKQTKTRAKTRHTRTKQKDQTAQDKTRLKKEGAAEK